MTGWLLLAALVTGESSAPTGAELTALRRAHLVPANPALSTIRRLCTLRLARRGFAALDVIERIPLAQSDRLYRHVVILDPRHRRTADLPYDPPARALPCAGVTLRFSAPVTVANTEPAGRRVRVSASGRNLAVVAD